MVAMGIINECHTPPVPAVNLGTLHCVGCGLPGVIGDVEHGHSIAAHSFGS